MGKYYQYVAIFETTLLEGHGQKAVIDPLKVELLPALPRTYVVPTFGPPVVAKGRGGLLARSSELRLEPPSRYIVLTARTAEDHPSVARRFCEDQVDRGVTNLAVIFGTAIFARRIYRGWIDDGDKVIVEAEFRGGLPAELPRRDLAKELLDMNQRLGEDSEHLRRYTLMSRFFSKAVVELANEEHFLYLWTILEIFPMKDTTNVRPIGDFLGQVIGREAGEVKERLGIGQLFGARSNLVHNGYLGLDERHLAEEIAKLESICSEVLGALSGRPYSGRLERYFDRRPPGA